MKDPNGLLMIEPNSAPSKEPLIDELTLKITAGWRNRTQDRNRFYKGVHHCICGARSSSQDHFIGGILTNSLCVHYMAYHRHDVPQEELFKVEVLTFGAEAPTLSELAVPIIWEPNPVVEEPPPPLSGYKSMRPQFFDSSMVRTGVAKKSRD